MRAPGDGIGQQGPEHDAGQGTADADHRRFAQELSGHIALPSAQRTQQADFAFSLQHIGQHDVHDADATDQQ